MCQAGISAVLGLVFVFLPFDHSDSTFVARPTVRSRMQAQKLRPTAPHLLQPQEGLCANDDHVCSNHLYTQAGHLRHSVHLYAQLPAAQHAVTEGFEMWL